MIGLAVFLLAVLAVDFATTGVCKVWLAKVRQRAAQSRQRYLSREGHCPDGYVWSSGNVVEPHAGCRDISAY